MDLEKKEIKTLKDLRKDRIKYFKKKLKSFGCPDSYLEQTAKSMALFLEKQERQEAIKWVKSNPRRGGLNRVWTVNDWIKHFFNITEENLEND